MKISNTAKWLLLLVFAIVNYVLLLVEVRSCDVKAEQPEPWSTNHFALEPATIIRSKVITNGVVTWQFDRYRNEINRVKRQTIEAEEFNRTNTNPTMNAIVTRQLLFEWRPQKGDIELGYRSDGIVVWREVPEAQ